MPAMNLTPMIDCTFQLIIFFMLSTQIMTQEYVRMELPSPNRSVAQAINPENRIIVNVAPYTQDELAADKTLMGMAKFYKIGIYEVNKADSEGMVRKLKQVRADRNVPVDKFVVEVRCDRRVQFKEVQPLLLSLQAAEMGKMHITALIQPTVEE